MEQSVLIQFIENGDFGEDSLMNFLFLNKTTQKKLLRDAFGILSEETKIIRNDNHYKMLIENTVKLIVFLCEREIFSENEIEIYRKKIKRNREKLLVFLKSSRDQSITKACNLLDEIILDKSINDKDLIKIIKKLIDYKTEVPIVKRVININKACILINENGLFDYVFNKLMVALNDDSRDALYYMTLLKIVYNSQIDKFYYINKLNTCSSEDSLLLKEAYNIICGNKRFLSIEEIKEKYNIKDGKQVKIKNKSRNVSDTNRLVISIDSSRTVYRDDALSIIKDGSKYIVGIHITDVGSFLNPGGDIDSICKRNLRNSYLYYKGTNILHSELSNVMSLSKNQNRKVISLYIILNKYGEIIDYNLKNDEILVSENLSHSDSEKILESSTSTDLKEALNKLLIFSSILYKKSDRKKAAIESGVTFYKNKSEMIVGEFAILYNKLLAQMAYDKNVPFVYKVQNPILVEELVDSLNIKVDDGTRSVLKSLYHQCSYSSVPYYNGRVFEKIYSQCTSPIRRYPDIYNQYLIHMFLLRNKEFGFNEQDYLNMINYFNQRDLDLRLFEQEYNREYVLSRKMRK